MAFQAGRSVQGELECWCAEDRALLGELQVVGLSAVVEPWRAVEHEPHLTAHAAHRPDQPVAVGCPLRVLDRHEVDHLADAAGGHEPGDQDGGVREVELPGDVVGALGGDPEVPAALAVEQRREHARGVEPRAAEPVDGAVGGHQRGGLQVTDQPVLGDRRIAVHQRSLLQLRHARSGPGPMLNKLYRGKGLSRITRNG